MKDFRICSFVVSLSLLSLCLLTSCSNPEKQAARQLEEKGYSPTVADLILAAGAGDTGSLELFQNAGIQIDEADSAGNTALIKAAAGGHLMTVERILGMGADPRHVNGVGRDALLSVSSKGFADVSRMLISRGADPTIKDKEGWNALSIAAYNGHEEVVTLLSSQVSPEELDDALLVSSFTGDSAVISTLLGHGANINARSPEGRTPLMIAAENGNRDATRTLLQNQANPYSKTADGDTAAMLAASAGHEELHEMIMSPDSWGTSPEAQAVVLEMAEAQEALATEAAVEETFGVAETEAEMQGGESTLSAPSEPTESVPAMRAAKVDRQQVRQEAKSKPVVSLNGSTLHSTSPKKAPVESMILASYHEEPLPIEVAEVNGDQAEIRRLDENNEEVVEVAPGSVIPGTPYEVKEVTRKFVSSKEGKGRMVDVSRVKVENRENGATHLLVKDMAGESSDTYAVLTAPASQYRYVVKSGDVFRTSQPGIGVKDYQVLDIRAGAVVVKDLATEEVLTIGRDGIIPTY